MRHFAIGVLIVSFLLLVLGFPVANVAFGAVMSWLCGVVMFGKWERR